MNGDKTTTATTKIDVSSSRPFGDRHSLELVNNSIQHIAFLQKLHAEGVTLREPSKKSIDRYLNFWLPFVATYQHQQVDEEAARHDSSSATEALKMKSVAVLVPPADIAWLWHCHRLAPFRYEAYCKKYFGIIVEPTSPFEFQQEHKDSSTAPSTTQKQWVSIFPSEPFFLQETKTAGDTNTLSGKPLDTNDGFSLSNSASRQRTFLWNVSQPSFHRRSFIEQGVSKYYKFLSLKQVNPSSPLVPTIQIDLVWHTHIALSVSKYNRDCIALRGEIFFHDDSLDDDRKPGGALDTAFQETSKLWKYIHKEEYEVKGGMYRGPPPPAYFCPSWAIKIHKKQDHFESEEQGADAPGKGSILKRLGKLLCIAGGNDEGTKKEATKMKQSTSGRRITTNGCKEASPHKTTVVVVRAPVAQPKQHRHGKTKTNNEKKVALYQDPITAHSINDHHHTAVVGHHHHFGGLFGGGGILGGGCDHGGGGGGIQGGGCGGGGGC
ncbi:hypothetical protein ACA910_009859 [Epithemia clementina (nom. ined.)]